MIEVKDYSFLIKLFPDKKPNDTLETNDLLSKLEELMLDNERIQEEFDEFKQVVSEQYRKLSESELYD